MISSNQIVLDKCIEAFARDNQLDDHFDNSKIFSIFSLFQITKDAELDFDEIEDCLVDGGQDGGIDGLAILCNDRYIFTSEDLDDIKLLPTSVIRVYISQDKREASFKEDALDKLLSSLPIILDFSKSEEQLLKRFNPMLTEKIKIFRKIYTEAAIKNSQFYIIFSYVCRAPNVHINSALSSKKDQILKLIKEDLQESESEFNFLSSKELLQLYKKQRMSTHRLRLKEQPLSVKYKNENGYIAVAAIKDFCNLIIDDSGKIREYIFENNVRYFQGAIDVNSKIKETLDSDYDRDFWWLNNGITIITSACRPLHKELILEDLIIVNGLQTSFVIAGIENKLRSESERSILVKVIETKDKRTIDKIISATNSQTPVSPILLRATDDIQRNLELYFDSKGYYYDRRKNYYRSKGKPIRKIFSIQFTAQAVEAILNCDPSKARSNPTTIIKDDKRYEAIFNDGIPPQTYLNCCLIRQKTHISIKKLARQKRGIMEYCVLHLSRILAAIITKNTNYTAKDISEINLDALSDDNIQKAHNLLKKILLSHIKHTKERNITNIAKSKKFTDAINEELKKIFTYSEK